MKTIFDERTTLGIKTTFSTDILCCSYEQLKSTIVFTDNISFKTFILEDKLKRIQVLASVGIAPVLCPHSANHERLAKCRMHRKRARFTHSHAAASTTYCVKLTVR